MDPSVQNGEYTLGQTRILLVEKIPVKRGSLFYFAGYHSRVVVACLQALTIVDPTDKIVSLEYHHSIFL